MAEPRLRIDVVYATPTELFQTTLELAAGATLADAVAASGLLDEHPELAPLDGRVGVYGRRLEPSHALRSGDRVEVYRPLELDPMEARRRRARGGA